LSGDGFAVPVDGSVSDSGSTVPVTPTEALFAAVNCVTAYQDATYNCYTPELQGLLASIRFNGQHSNGPHWPPVLSCAELSSQLAKHQPCRVASVTGGKMVSTDLPRGCLQTDFDTVDSIEASSLCFISVVTPSGPSSVHSFYKLGCYIRVL